MVSRRASSRVIYDRGRQVAGWADIDWKRTQYNVRRLQARIAKATQAKKWRQVKRLQRLLTRSFSAKALAINKTVTNRGRKTPGVDGVIWDSPKKKWDAIFEINQKRYRSKPLKRIKIPKNNRRKEYRNLSIPCKRDMAMQALYQLGLDPVSETTSDKHSYGFRKERCCQDAIEQCFTVLCRQKGDKYILEADISKCFDEISHSWIEDHIPIERKILQQFLKAGYIERNKRYSTHKGTPQGGIISPTIANMTLDGIEDLLDQKLGKKKSSSKRERLGINHIRYADDLVITGKTYEAVIKVQEILEEFLKTRGLKLSKEKTKISHIEEGFNFLGFNIRKYKGKLIIKPQKEKITLFLSKIGKIIKEFKADSQDNLISKLNPIIRGWCNYYRFVCSKRIFQKIDHLILRKLWFWAKRRHPSKSKKWLKERYWCKIGNRDWRFVATSKITGETCTTLIAASDTKIIRHTKIKSKANPYLPEDDHYFINRLLKKWQLTDNRKIKRLVKRQKGLCPVCRKPIAPEDRLEIDHIQQRCSGGTGEIDNLRLVCYNCHRQRHSKQITLQLAVPGDP